MPVDSRRGQLHTPVTNPPPGDQTHNTTHNTVNMQLNSDVENMLITGNIQLEIMFWNVTVFMTIYAYRPANCHYRNPKPYIIILLLMLIYRLNLC